MEGTSKSAWRKTAELNYSDMLLLTSLNEEVNFITTTYLFLHKMTFASEWICGGLCCWCWYSVIKIMPMLEVTVMVI